MYLVSVVYLNNGKEDRQLILDAKPGQADKLHDAHQAEQKAFWWPMFRPVGGWYQGFDSLVDAMKHA